MVISDKNKYLFVELYFTGSTAISTELCDMYDGKKILRKHSRYHEFLKKASAAQKRYFVFSGIRNPMDMIVSDYLKIKNNHKGRYTNPAEWRRNGGSLSDKKLQLYQEIAIGNMRFGDFFKKYYKLPYDNWSSLDHKKFDHIIRFENIQQDFSAALIKTGLQQKRELPHINKTTEKKNFIDFYTPEIKEQAVFVFGPFMKKWGYEFPGEWNIKKLPVSSIMLFNLMSIVKKTYWRMSESKSTLASKIKSKPAHAV